MPPSVLRDSKSASGVGVSSVFNRDAARSLILGKLAAPTGKLSGGAAPSPTGHKLLETLTTLSKQADKENVSINASGIKSMLKTGGARRVPTGNAAASPAAHSTAASASAAAVSSAAAGQHAAEAKLQQVEGEKQVLQHQVDALRKETQQQSAAMAAAQQQLADKDAAATKLQSLVSQLQQQLAAQSAELAQARTSIAQLQNEKEALLERMKHNSSEVDSRATTTVLAGSEHAHGPLLAHLHTASNNASAAISEDATVTVAGFNEGQQNQQQAQDEEDAEDEDGDEDTAVVFAVRAEQAEQPMANDEDTALVTFAAPAAATAASVGMVDSNDDDVTAAQPVAALFQPAGMREPLEVLDAADAAEEADASDDSIILATPEEEEEEQDQGLDQTLPEPEAKAVTASASLATAAPQATGHDDDFQPITADDMEASLNESADLFAINADEEHATAAASASSAAAAASGVNESSSSLNLSINSSALSANGSNRSSCSPFLAGPLPASFRSNPTSPSSDLALGLAAGLGVGMGAEGLLSPISSSPPAAAASKASASASALSHSALKLQAHFRGRMERTYLRTHEARLAALPLTSPSTPLRTGGDSPLAKRQRLSNSPVACRMLTEEDECDSEDEGLLGRRELSFGADEEVETVPKIRAPRGRAIAGAKSATAAVAALRITPFGGSSSAAVAPAPSPVPAPVSPHASLCSPLSILEQRRVQSELKQHRSLLSTIEQCWTLRSKAMNAIEAVVRERGAGSMAGWNAWPQELAHLQRAMAAQLGDLRSSIMREACRLLIALAEASPRDFEDSAQLSFYAPLLFKGLYVTIKIISSTCDETMSEIVTRVATVKSVPTFLAALSDVHSVVREKSACYLLQIVAAHSGTAVGVEALEPYLSSLSAAIRAQTQDPDGKVRAAWRALFHALRAPFPAQMDALLADLPQPVQKAVDMDRKQRAQSAKAAVGAKRKK